ncbi:magnesium transporter [Agarivorans sp. Toyoura001]|uniref:magnesium transporter n=1 Tax=Agarivorans sp. Toyoura001 TaxID=2283141 RepID=UPI0010E63C09|nr:magnesium transporter [Agarivorans sp. Toyoura001]GDY26944.1 magnesium transporter [Agarivorans sp. Toyoura001]
MTSEAKTSSNQQTFDGHHDAALRRVLDALDQEQQPADLSFISQYDNAILANLIESLPDGYRQHIWPQCSTERYWDILHLMQYETVKHLLSQFSQQQLNELQHFVSDTEIVEFADILPDSMVDIYLEQQDELTAAQLQDALSYEDEQVGRYVDTHILRARPNSTVERIKQRLSTRSNKHVAIYLVDANGQFQGACSMTDISNASDHTRLSELGQSIEVFDHQQMLADIALSLNVVPGHAWHPVQRDGKIIGAIALSNIVQWLQERSLDIAISDSPSDEEDLFTPVPTAAKMRAIWLTTNLATAFLASWVIGLFEGALQQLVALAILMPVVASMGGIAGSQTLAVALRGIALNHLQQSNLKLLLNKELKIAAFNGLMLGLVIAGVVSLWFQSLPLGMVIFVAIVLNSLAAAASATMIPFVLKKMKIDPAVAGSVILTTVTDIVGFVAFLGLASLFLIS